VQTALASALIEERLSFGTFAVSDNSVTSTLIITDEGRTFSTGSINVVRDGQPAVIRLSNYPTYTVLFLTPNTPAVSQTQSGVSPLMTLVELYIPNSITTDALGEATFFVGGKLETSGQGGSYQDTDYFFNLSFSVNY
tara:strand:+ start:684 stop:1097 length:414 start_codon:yes stop_codon:yes gene_type:complete